jgi:hypothetical protein
MNYELKQYLHSAPKLKLIDIDPESLQVQRATSLEEEQGKLTTQRLDRPAQTSTTSM